MLGRSQFAFDRPGLPEVLGSLYIHVKDVGLHIRQLKAINECAFDVKAGCRTLDRGGLVLLGERMERFFSTNGSRRRRSAVLLTGQASSGKRKIKLTAPAHAPGVDYLPRFPGSSLPVRPSI